METIMRKKYISFALFSYALLLVGCGPKESLSRQELSSDDPSTTIISSNDDVSSNIESSTVRETLVTDLQESEYKTIPSLYLKKLVTFKTYEADTAGQTVSKVPLVGDVTQVITVNAIKSEEYSYLFNHS